jgi:hypothetical protein
MGHEWVEDKCDFTIEDVFDDVYVEAGTVDADSPEDAYRKWEAGDGHDPTSTRSMAVGDVIVFDGDAHFVDSIGFVTVGV